MKRERAMLDGELVTILNVTGPGKNAKVEIRTATGFVTTVSARQLKRLDANDPNRWLDTDVRRDSGASKF